MRSVTIITGASSGLGRAFALRAAAEGEVLLLARGEAGLASLAAEIKAGGGRSSWMSCDGTDAGAVASILSYLSANGMFCEQLVNNAGFGVVGLAGEADKVAPLHSIDLNVRFLTELSLALLPGMLARRSGGLLNVGSVAGFLPGPGMAVYYATKAYVQYFTNSLWQETRGTGVRVTALAPGPVNTGFLARATAGRLTEEQTWLHVAADEVVRQGWHGFKAGKRLVVPGLPNRLVLCIAHLLPRGMLAGMIMRRQQGRISKA